MRYKRFRLVVPILLVVGIIVACSSKPSVEDPEFDDWVDYREQPDSTSPEVAEWFTRVTLDSAERILSRHDGWVHMGDTTVMMWFSDILRCRTADAMDYPFEELVDSLDMTILSTDDGRLRFFYWNTGMGGTCPDIARYTLLKADDGTVHLLKGGHGSPQLIDIYQLKTTRGDRVYLLHEYFREWSTYGAAWVWCCRIKDNTLDTLAPFPRGDTAIGVEYGIPGWYFDANDGEGWGWLFELHGDDLYVPVVIDNGITDRYDLYHWNGTTFDSVGNVGNRRLHQSLQQYYELCTYFVTKGFRVRIDRMADDSYRYASWPRSKETSVRPDLVIEGGRYDEQKDCYTFENEGYTYYVGSFMVNDENRRGLVVSKDGKVLLKQEKEYEDK